MWRSDLCRETEENSWPSSGICMKKRIKVSQKYHNSITSVFGSSYGLQHYVPSPTSTDPTDGTPWPSSQNAFQKCIKIAPSALAASYDLSVMICQCKLAGHVAMFTGAGCQTMQSASLTKISEQICHTYSLSNSDVGDNS